MSSAERQQVVKQLQDMTALQRCRSLPCVNKVAEVFIERDRLCIVSELAGNGSLAELLHCCQAAKQQLHDNDVWAFLMQMAHALQVRQPHIEWCMYM